VTLHVHAPADGSQAVTRVPAPDGSAAPVTFTTRRAGDEVVVETDSALPWNVLLVGAAPGEGGQAHRFGALYRLAAGTTRLAARLG
jgi:alpha-D-xyloside xylohydrolase